MLRPTFPQLRLNICDTRLSDLIDMARERRVYVFDNRSPLPSIFDHTGDEEHPESRCTTRCGVTAFLERIPVPPSSVQIKNGYLRFEVRVAPKQHRELRTFCFRYPPELLKITEVPDLVRPRLYGHRDDETWDLLRVGERNIRAYLTDEAFEFVTERTGPGPLPPCEETWVQRLLPNREGRGL